MFQRTILVCFELVPLSLAGSQRTSVKVDGVMPGRNPHNSGQGLVNYIDKYKKSRVMEVLHGV